MVVSNSTLFKKHVLDVIGKRINSFKQIRDAIAKNTSPSMRGKLFEIFSYSMLATDVTLQVSRIYRMEDTPETILNRLGLKSSEDNGIDTIIIDKNDNIIAVQDKFKTFAHENVTWSDLSTFFASSVNANYRLVVTTAMEVDKMNKTPLNNNIQKITYSKLSSLDKDRLKEVIDHIMQKISIPHKKKKMQKHQINAMNDVIAELNINDRASLISACGTGKTLTSERITEKMFKEGGDIVVFLPSLNLIRQTIFSWSLELRYHKNYKFMAVCSDKTVVDNNDYDAADINVDEVGFPVSTDVQSVVSFLERPREKNEIRVIYISYQSSKILAQATKEIKKSIDFGIFDEGHRTVASGTKEYIENESPFSHALFDSNIVIKKRLFMTATPRIRVAMKKEIKGEKFYFISMDDIKTYGRVAHRYSFKQAAADGVICKFKIIVSTIDHNELSEFKISHVSMKHGNEMKFNEAVKMIALKKAIAKTNVKRVISYHSRLSDALNMSNELKLILPNWNVGHISSRQNVSMREKITQTVRDNDNSIITNVRCLAEGADFPAVDMVALMSRIDSKTDIVQIVGRSLRLDGNKKYGYVMLPLILSDAENPSDDDVYKAGYDTIWRVIGSLMDDDEELYDIIEMISSSRVSGDRISYNRNMKELSKYIDIVGVTDVQIMNQMKVAVVDKLSSSFSVGYGHLEKYVKQYKTVVMPNKYITPDGFELSNWLNRRKSEWNNGILSKENIKKLEKLGVKTITHDKKVERGIMAMEAYMKKYKDKKFNKKFAYEGMHFSQWISSRRRDIKNNKLHPALVEFFKEKKINLLDDTDNKGVFCWENGFKRIDDYYKVHKNYDINLRYKEKDGYPLGKWMNIQRVRWVNGRLDDEQIEFLQQRNIPKNVIEATFWKNVDLLKEIKKEKGDINIVSRYVYKNVLIGSWLWDNKKKIKNNTLDKQKRKALEKLGLKI